MDHTNPHYPTTAAGLPGNRTETTDLYDALALALRTPGLHSHHEVLAAAKAYRAYFAGEKSIPTEQPPNSSMNLTDGQFARALLGGSAAQQTATGPQILCRGNFGFALASLKAGRRVARAGWNGTGMFVYLVPANNYLAQTGAAKAFFGEGGMVPYNAYLALKGADDTVSTWAPSGSDALAEDWLIVK